ncbi:MAG: hypothetical protein V2A79_07165, partial [Planctomycetota bacterium]
MVTNMMVVFLLAMPGLRVQAAPAAAPSKGGVEAVASQPAGDFEIVKVNGASIRHSEFQDKLLQDYGQAVMENMINRLLLIQETKSRKIAADDAEVAKRLAMVKGRFPNEEALADNLKR